MISDIEQDESEGGGRPEGVDRFFQSEMERPDRHGPALALYRGHGFVQGDAFADYAPGNFSQFFHLVL